MDWKEFFKPNKQKIILLIILIFVSYISLISSIAISAAIPQNRAYCIGRQAETLYPSLAIYLFSPLSLLLFGQICNRFLLVLINLPYLYLISCLISYIFSKLLKH